MGVGPKATSVTPQINMIVNGEMTGNNFVDDFTFLYAKKRVANKQPNETIDEYRLFNNLLSSQPMAFNLFCPFIKMLEQGKQQVATDILQHVFPEYGIQEVTEVRLEYLHEDIQNYLNDKTAMDAIIRYRDVEGQQSFIAIETKYTDTLNPNSASRTERHKEWIKRLGVFKKASEEELLDGRRAISQIYRNFLLTESYGVVEGANRYYSVVLSPALHPTTEVEVASVRDELLPQYQYKLRAVSLESFIEQALAVCPQEETAPFNYFYRRYLDFSKLT